MIAGILAIVATAGWMAFFASAARDRKRVDELDEAGRRLTECRALNHDLSREVARLKEERNINV